MDKNESLKEINMSIKGLVKERNSEAYDIMGFNILDKVYYTHAPQLAAIASSTEPAILTLLSSVGLSAGVIYLALLRKHYLSKDIESLKQLKGIIINNYNVLENTTIEQFESDVANRKYVKK